MAAWSHLVLFLTIAAIVSQHIVTLPRPLTYSHAWGAAGAAVEARAFRLAGIVALKAAPIHNNPPFGAHPEADVHWPPLVYLALAFWTERFGEGEASIHGFALSIFLITTALLYYMLLDRFGSTAASFGVLAWLTLPVCLRYSHVVLNEALELPLVITSVTAFSLALEPSRRRGCWLVAGVAAIVLAVLSAWQAVLVPLGLLAGAIWNRDADERRAATILLGAAAATAACILGWYAFAYPVISLDTVQAVLYRVGVSGSYSANPLHNLSESFPAMTRWTMIRMVAVNLARMAGPFGLMTLVGFCWSQAGQWRERAGGRSFTIFCGLMFPPLLWFPIFMNHAAIHEFETILLAPAVAFAVAGGAGQVLVFLAARRNNATALLWTTVAGCVLMLLVPLLRQIHGSLQLRAGGGVFPVLAPREHIMAPDDEVEFGYAIRDRTAREAVVLTPEMSSVPLYYSRRHMIGGIGSDEDISRVLPMIRQDFQGIPIYLALFSRERQRFPGALGGSPPIRDSDRFIVVKLAH